MSTSSSLRTALKLQDSSFPASHTLSYYAGTSEVHPSAVEAAPNGDAPHEALANGVSNAPNAYSGYKHPGGLVGRKVYVQYSPLGMFCSSANPASLCLFRQDSIEAMQSVFNAHINLPQTRQLLVPHEVIDYVDQGRNPDIYTKELLDRVSGENMYTNGILDAVSVSCLLLIYHNGTFTNICFLDLSTVSSF